MLSKKSNLQATSRKDQSFAWWLVGFTDGEGCFSVSKFRNPTTRSGWQVFPEFVVTQGESSKQSLDEIKDFFKCGGVYINRRNDNHKEDLYRYCVRSVDDLINVIIPFFEKHPLKTAKQKSFMDFKKKVEAIKEKRSKR